MNPLSLRFAIEPVGLQVEFEISPGECIRIGSSEEMEVTIPQSGLAEHHISIERRQDGRIYLVLLDGVDPSLEGHEAGNPIELPARFETGGLQFNLEKIEATESTLSLPQDPGDSDSVDFTHIPLNRESGSSEKVGGRMGKRFVFAVTAILIGVGIIGGWVISDWQSDSASISKSESVSGLVSETEAVPAAAPQTTVTVPVANPPEPSTPTMLTGVLQLDSSPGGADVFVDGKKKGMTPEFAGLTLSLTLPEGEHEILISKEGAGSASRTIFIGSDVIQPLTLVITPVDVPEVRDKGLPSQVVNAAPNKPGEVVYFPLHGGNFIRFRYCPPGTFQMGVAAVNNQTLAPVAVTLTQGFWMAETECTQSQWNSVMGTTTKQQAELVGEGFLAGRDTTQSPMRYVSFEEAEACCEKLSAVLGLPEGWQCVLPSEAQWEYACRAGTTTAFHFGDTLPDNRRDHGYHLGDVGLYPPNAWGIHDMHAGVNEWCGDRYRERLKGGIDPSGAATGIPRVIKGGTNKSISNSLLTSTLTSQSGWRLSSEPGIRRDFTGFRPALVLGTGGSAVNLSAALPVIPPPKCDGLDRPEVLNSGGIGKTVSVHLPGEVLMSFAYCPPGEFMMGDPGATDPTEKETKVTLSSGFWMATTECTQAQWEMVMHRTLREQAVRAGTMKLSGEDEEQPIYYVSHYDAVDYCAGLTAMAPLPAGWKYALPTEAQWEYACRAGTRTKYSFGDEFSDRDANFKSLNTAKTKIVGSYKPNEWGLFDMHGNVSEWCADWIPDFDADYDLAGRKQHAMLPGGTDPIGPTDGPWKIDRGGNCETSGSECRSFDRGFSSPGQRALILGFRLAIVPEKQTGQ